MGAGKTTIGREVAALTQRPFVDTDEEIEKLHGPVPRIFEERGEAEFREIEERVVADALGSGELAVVALGGGAVASETTRRQLGQRALTVWIEVDADVAWARSSGSDRPLARSERDFRRLFEHRNGLYETVSDEAARDIDDVLLAGVSAYVDSDVLGPRRPDPGAVVIADERVLDLHPLAAFPQAVTHRVSAGEDAKRLTIVEHLWDALDVGRDGTLVAYGGGTITDLAGFIAATYLRGIRWITIPTTLVGQVDAAIGGKTGIDLRKGKNLVGAFHYPDEVVIDVDLLVTLPDRERAHGMAEVVKTGLLAGHDVWELSDKDMVRASAAFKCAVCLSDPYERTGRRAILNLGHTFAHALEAASDYAVPHGEAVALGLLAALRLSGQPTDVIQEILRPEPVRADRERAWAAMKRDKKAEGGRVRLVLLEAPGRPRFPVELPDADVRRELDRLIAD